MPYNRIRDFADPGYNHGTIGGYKKGCRCYECRRAMADYHLARRSQDAPKYLFLKGMPLDHSDFPHGTARGYRYCKCDKCRSGNAAAKKEANARWRQSPKARALQRQLNVAYRQSEVGAAKRRALHAKRKASLRGAQCSAEEKVLLEAIYAACPAGYQVDHQMPLSRGGAHRPDNLQYLPSEVNNAKRAKIDFDCSAHAIAWQDLVEPSTTRAQARTAKRLEVPGTR